MLEIARQLESDGHSVQVPVSALVLEGKDDATINTHRARGYLERDVIKDHYQLIKNADAILVVNYEKHGIPNYIGGNTLMEIGFAHVLGRTIYLLNPIPDISFYQAEIAAIHPTIVNGDIKQIR